MSVDWFLMDAPHVVPHEFQAWETARKRHNAIAFRCCDAVTGSAEQAALDAEGQAAKIEVDRLEQIARETWIRKRQATGE